MVDQEDVVNKVIEVLKAMDLTGYGFSASDIKYVDFPFDKPPSHGLLVSPLTETEGESLTETSDIGYPVQLVRCGHRVSGTDGLTSRSAWRYAVKQRFNRKRLGLSCELITRSEFDTIEIKDVWKNWNLDASALKITVWIRQAIHS